MIQIHGKKQEKKQENQVTTIKINPRNLLENFNHNI